MLKKASIAKIYNLTKSADLGLVKAFHCGRDIGDSKFSVDYFGSGEGMAILGPGIYFATSQGIAEMYAKYHAAPCLYSVEIDTSNFYECTTGKPERIRDALSGIIKKLEEELGYKVYGKNFNSLRFGRGDIGDICKAVGKQKCNQILVENGIDGAIEKCPNFIELCVFNIECIQSINKVPFSAEYLERKN